MISLLFIFCLGHANDQKPVVKATRRPASTLSKLEASIRTRGQFTRYTIGNTGGHFTIEVESRQHKGKRDLNTADINAIHEQFEALPTVEKVGCFRSRMDVTVTSATGRRHKASCLSDRGVTAPAYHRFIDALAARFDQD